MVHDRLLSNHDHKGCALMVLAQRLWRRLATAREIRILANECTLVLPCYLASCAKQPPSAGLAKDDFFTDVTVLNGPLEGPKRSSGAASEGSRSLLWADAKVPAAWCGPEAGRLLVVRSPVGHAHDGDVLVGMQSAEGPSECLRSAEAVAGGIMAPRPMAFTPLAGPGSNLEWVKAILAEHGRGPGTLLEGGAGEGQQQQRDRGDRSLQEVAGDGAGCGTTGNGEFQNLQLEDCR